MEQQPDRAAQQGDPPPHGRRLRLSQSRRRDPPRRRRVAEAHDEWISAERRYLSLDALTLTRRLIDPAAPEVVDVAA
jgi:hypothetical protein